MNPVDPYLIPRKAISPNWDNAHLLEVDGLCPLCGDYLLKNKNSRMKKNYEIAHIYPNSPNEHQLSELKGLERLGESCEDFDNKIALCQKCHDDYDTYTTKTEYLHLLELKKTLLLNNKSKATLSRYDVEPEIESILDELHSIELNKLDDFELNYKVLKVSQKIEDDYMILRKKIEYNVCLYYGYIREYLRYLESNNDINFELLATSIRLAFLKSSDENSKSDIFNNLVNWLISKTTNKSRESCEIVISFFVQNCEVFDEISK